MTLDDAALQSRAKITPWHGRKVQGLPIHTLVRGRFVMRDRTLVEGTRGHGRSVHTIQAMPRARAAQHRPDDAIHHPRAGAANRERRMSEDDFVRLENVAVTYGRKAEQAVTALDETNLRIGQGDFIALVGPSGCGKSTILKLVGGLIPASRGYVYVAGREVGAEPVRIGMAFQNPTLLPWLKIRDNVMLPLKIVPPFRGQYRAKKNTEFKDRADALLAQVGLSGFGDKYPWQLSGGMLQRASLCRALVHDPQLLLLDEPFGALDQFTREELWAIMQELWVTRSRPSSW